MKSPSPLAFLPLAALTLLLQGCSPRAEGADASPAPTSAVADTAYLSTEAVRIGGLTTTPVTRERWRDGWAAAGRLTLDPANTEPIGSIVEGRVTKVYVMPGDRVRQDQVLVAIHSHEMMDARASLTKARAAVMNAESALRVATTAAERAGRLHAIKALSLADLERAQAAQVDAQALRDGAAAELTRAEGLLEHLIGHGVMPTDYDDHWVLIRAPMDGIVVRREVQPGNVVLVGAPLLTVSGTGALTLVMHVPDAALAAARPGTPVTFTTAARDGGRFDATVTRVFPAMDTVTRTVEVHAAVRNANARLRAEMFVTAELAGEAGGDVVTVPAAAVQSLDGEPVVVAAQSADDGMILEAVAVRIGRRTRDRVEVIAGIDTGRVVVVGGAAVARAELLKRRGAR